MQELNMGCPANVKHVDWVTFMSMAQKWCWLVNQSLCKSKKILHCPVRAVNHQIVYLTLTRTNLSHM